MVARDLLPGDLDAKEAFTVVARTVLPVGLFGFVVAALVAALMSTADTLINAVAAIGVVEGLRRWCGYKVQFTREFIHAGLGKGAHGTVDLSQQRAPHCPATVLPRH